MTRGIGMIGDGMATGVFSGEWLLTDNNQRYTEAYVGEPVASWPSGDEWLAERAVAERVVATQRRLRADLIRLDDMDDLRFDGDALLHVDVDGNVVRHEPDQHGRYLMSFGFTWQNVDPPVADVVYGNWHVASVYQDVLDGLRAGGVWPCLATAPDRAVIYVGLADGGWIEACDAARNTLTYGREFVRRWSATLFRADGVPDCEVFLSRRDTDAEDAADLVRHVTTTARAYTVLGGDAPAERVAHEAFTRIRRDVAAGTMPWGRSFEDLRDYGAESHFVHAFTVLGSDADSADPATVDAAVELLDQALALTGGLRSPQMRDRTGPAPAAAIVSKRLEWFAQQPPDGPALWL